MLWHTEGVSIDQRPTTRAINFCVALSCLPRKAPSRGLLSSCVWRLADTGGGVARHPEWRRSSGVPRETARHCLANTVLFNPPTSGQGLPCQKSVQSPCQGDCTDTRIFEGGA